MEDQYWRSRRSPVYSTQGICASSQPLASKIGTSILEQGGNAADAIIGMAAALSVCEPMSTGLGGDAFLLYFDASSRKITSFNGSGHSPWDLSFAEASATLRGDRRHANAVTVPGACALWVDAVERFGALTLAAVLQPAVDLAQRGFPVSDICARLWRGREQRLLTMVGSANGALEMLVPGGRSPACGELFVNTGLARVLREIQRGGKDGFYRGWVADEIVAVIRGCGGRMSKRDLESHETTIGDPICTMYKQHYCVHEVGPNSQGIVALMALNILEQYNVREMQHNSADYLHLLIETLRLSFSDANAFVCDPSKYQESGNVLNLTDKMLSKSYAKQRSSCIQLEQSNKHIEHGEPLLHSDTVYLCAVDKYGNAASMVNSNYEAFGTGIVPKGCGFSLQNRGLNFSFDPTHMNAYEPHKRPYHTIIPAMCTTNDGDLYCTFGVMGGVMQPQGHVQVLLNMIEFGMNPQQALDAPRICLSNLHDDLVLVEHGIDDNVVEQLKSKNHDVSVVHDWERKAFGRGQIIVRKHDTGVLQAGSDPRADGMAVPAL